MLRVRETLKVGKNDESTTELQISSRWTGTPNESVPGLLKGSSLTVVGKNRFIISMATQDNELH